MATVVQQPRKTLLSDISRGLAKGIETFDEDRQQEELIDYLSRVQQTQSVEEFDSLKVPSALATPDGAVGLFKIKEQLFPSEDRVQFFDQKKKPTAIRRPSQRRPGERTLEELKAFSSIEKAKGGGSKLSTDQLAATTLAKMDQNQLAEGRGEKPPFTISKVRQKLVQSKLADPNRAIALKIASETREFNRLRDPREKVQYVNNLVDLLSGKTPESSITGLPPGVTEAQLNATAEQFKLSLDEAREAIWKQFIEGSRNAQAR